MHFARCIDSVVFGRRGEYMNCVGYTPEIRYSSTQYILIALRLRLCLYIQYIQNCMSMIAKDYWFRRTPLLRLQHRLFKPLRYLRSQSINRGARQQTAWHTRAQFYETAARRTNTFQCCRRAAAPFPPRPTVRSTSHSYASSSSHPPHPRGGGSSEFKKCNRFPDPSQTKPPAH